MTFMKAGNERRREDEDERGESWSTEETSWQLRALTEPWWDSVG